MHRQRLSILVLFAITLTLFTSFSVPTKHIEQVDMTNNSSPVENELFSYTTSDTFPVAMNITGNSYSTHSSISITSNSDFLSLRDSEVWDGSGTALDPIIITGYNFTSTSESLISISNTDLYFKIDNNFFNVPTENFDGISLSNVTNGIITNNYFDNADAGIRFSSVNYTTVDLNHFTTFTGVYVGSGNNNSISNNFVNASDTAIMLFGSSTFYNTVFNNTLQGSSYGVYLLGSSQNEINLNYLVQILQYSFYVTQFGGVYASFNIIKNNVIRDSLGSGITGIYLSSYSHNNAISLNNITNVTLSIRLSYSDNNTINDNVISNTTQAVSIESSQWTEVYRNNISDVTDGYDGAIALNLYKGGNNTLHHNNITDADNGFLIYQSGMNILYDNHLSSIRAFGANMMTAVLNSVYDNEIEGGTTGFYLHVSSTNNTLTNNHLQLQDQGIQIQDTSHYTTIVGNVIENATNYGIDSTTSSYLTITHNNITNSGLRGINIDPTSYHEIAFNRIINNGQYGIYMNTGLGSDIFNNTIMYHSSAGAYVISTNQYNISFNIFANSTIGLSLPISDGGHVIGNTFANNTDTGLFLDGTDGIFITDNVFENNGVRGLRLSTSGGNVIENNTIRKTAQHGIVIESGSDTNFLRYNLIDFNSGYGIWVRAGPNTIRLNNISNNGVGIYVDTANTISIESNNIGNNTDGVRLMDSDSNTIYLNTIYNNSQYGIYSESGFPEENNGNKIYNNTVLSNGVYGVWLDATARTTEVKWNDFINNADNARDSNPSTNLNVWDGNFYDDWDQLQSYYSIIGTNIRDYNPSLLPLYPSRVHFMLSATITSPVESTANTGDITISWSPAYDSQDHAITYTLYYSNNSGGNWYSLVSGLTNTSFYWNASSLPEGTEYQVRIVTTDTANMSLITDTGSFSIDNKAPRLGILPSNFTVEISFDMPPPVFFSAFDSNPDYAYVEWSGWEMTDPVFWSNDTEEQLDFWDGSVQFGVGVHPLYLVVLDIAGHETRYLFYMTVEDTVAPTIVLEETNQTFELGSPSSSLVWSADDLATGDYEVYFNNSLDMSGTWSNYAGPALDVSTYMPGIYNVTIIYYDSSGNNVSRSINLTIVDTTAPSIHAYPSDDSIEIGSTGNFLNWTVEELDPSSYDLIINYVFNESIVYSNGTLSLNIDGLSLGINNVTVVFYDNSGNLANDTVYITVSDTISPDITTQSDVILEFGSVGNVVDWTASDVLPSNYSVYVDDIYWISGVWTNNSIVSIPIDGLSVGNHSFRIHFADTVNNTAIGEIVVSVQDTILPTWEQQPLNQVIELGSIFYLDVTASDLSLVSYSIDSPSEFSIDSVSGEITNATALGIGIYEIQINATDSEGNVLSITLTISIEDTTPPEIISFSENMEYTVGATGNTISWIAFDLDPDNYSIYIDGSVVDTDTWAIASLVSISVDGLSEGAHTVEIRFFDNSGNVVSRSVTVTVLPLATSTNTTNTDTPPSEGNPLVLIIIGSSAAGVILVVLGITVIRKRGS